MKARFILVFAFGCGGDTETVEGCADATDDPTLDAGTTDARDAADAADARDARDANEGDVVLFPIIKDTCGQGCEGGTPVCCAQLDFVPRCQLQKITLQCASELACTTQLQPFCNAGRETVRVCGDDSECTEPGYNRCCHFEINNPGHNTLVMCASLAMANAVGATCP